MLIKRWHFGYRFRLLLGALVAHVSVLRLFWSFDRLASGFLGGLNESSLPGCGVLSSSTEMLVGVVVGYLEY